MNYCERQALQRRLGCILIYDRLEQKTIDVPLLFIGATKDAALPPALSEGMEESCSRLSRKSVATSHWALWEAPVEVNGHIKEWLERVDVAISRL